MSVKSAESRNNFVNLFRQISWALSSTAFLVLAGFVINILIGNLLGAAGLGVYSLALTIFMLMQVVASMGMPQALTRYTAEYIEQPVIAAQFFTAGIFIALICTLIAGLILLLAREILANLFKMPELVQLLPILAVGLPFAGLNKVMLGRLNGLRNMRHLAIGEISRYLLLGSLTVISLLWMKGGLVAAVWSIALSEIILCPLLVLFVQLPKHLSLRNISQRTSTLFWFGKQVVFSRTIEELGDRFNLLLVGLFLTKSEVGVFSLAVTLTSALYILPRAAAITTGPVMTEMYSKHQTSSMESLVNQTMALFAFLLTSASTLLVIFFPLIISILYPNQPEFQSARLAFTILMVGGIFRGIVTSISPIFFSTNRPDLNMPIASARVFSNIALTALLVGVYRINGAALGNAVASFVLFIFLLYLMKQRLNVSTRYWPLFLIPLIGVVILCIEYWLPHSSRYWDVVRFSLWLLATGLIIRLWHFEVYFQRLSRSTWIGHFFNRQHSARPGSAL